MPIVWMVLCLLLQLAYSPTGLASCEVDRILLPLDPPVVGMDVLELQQRLQALGYFEGNMTGQYDEKTAVSITRFQTDRGLVADAVVDSETWTMLGSDWIVSVATAAKPVGEMYILVDAKALRLTLYVNSEPYKSYPVAIGRPSQFTLSPEGEWRIIQKSLDWGGGFGTRWLGLNVPWGIYGIHGTNKPWSIGTRASAGCIRMLNHDVEELYDWVETGTPVKIIGVDMPIEFNRNLQSGATGKDVVHFQFRLKEFGFDTGPADGRFGKDTARAVTQLQRLYGLPQTGIANDDIYYLLGLK